jgi:hypothetical protein
MQDQPVVGFVNEFLWYVPDELLFGLERGFSISGEA